MLNMSTNNNSSSRKEQIFNSAGGLAANLFEKFDKLRKQPQQQQHQSNINEPSSTSNLISSLAISFHKNIQTATTSSNNASPTASTTPIITTAMANLTNNNLLIVDDDDHDDSNFDISTAINTQKSLLTKSKSAAPADLIASGNSGLVQSQSDFDLNNNNTVNANTAKNVISPTTASIPASSSLFKISSEFLDDLRLKTNLAVDEAEVKLKRKFFHKDKTQSFNSELTPSLSMPMLMYETKKQDKEISESIAEPSILPEPSPETSQSATEAEIENKTETETEKEAQMTTISTPNIRLFSSFKLAMIVPVICSILIYYLIRSLSSFDYLATFLIYFGGFISGSLIVTFGLAFILFKYNLLQFSSSKTVTATAASTVNNYNSNNTQQIHSLLIQTAIHKQNKNFDGVYKVWLNELREPYDPDTYKLNKTRPVYANLDGTTLRLQTATATSKVPRRGIISSSSSIQFNEQRIYDLTDCECFILPSQLVRKRYWSKKYPVCLKGVTCTSGNKSADKFVHRKSSLSYENTTKIINQSLNSILTNPAEQTTPIDSEQHQQMLSLDSSTLILFFRNDREKEEWFKLFKKSAAKSLPDSNSYMNQKKMQRSQSIICNKLLVSNHNHGEKSISLETQNDKLLHKLVNTNETDSAGNESLNANNSTEQLNVNTQTDTGLLYDTSLNFMNTFLIRIFSDFFTENKWKMKVKNKIQNKLNTIQMPYFMEELKIIDLDLGFMIPLIKQTKEPWYDEKGLWCHLDIDYAGGIQILISTKLNLMKLKSNSSLSSSSITSFKNINNQEGTNGEEDGLISITSNDMNNPKNNTNNQDNIIKKKRLHLAIIDSDEEDSPESSGDEYYSSPSFPTSSYSLNSSTSSNSMASNNGINLVNNINTNSEDDKTAETSNTSKKLLNIVNKIASSNYFQKATEIKYIKKAMENVSNCQLLLNVEVKKIQGTIALNIPSHPSDRIWYGFTSNPLMHLTATPQVGDKEVSYSAITDWIAEKLKNEFQKVLVHPNMDDFYIPILNSEIDYKNW